jgi:nicotinamide-nucleotide amidase
MVRAEIITIGDEILYGQILDTNTQWISQELDKLGILTVRK